MLELRTSTRFKREFARLSSPLKRATEDIAQLLRELPLDPSLEPKQLVDVPGNLYRVRVNGHRLVYSFTTKTLLLYAVRHRRDVYRSL